MREKEDGQGKREKKEAGQEKREQKEKERRACFHLPGLFEFHELYAAFLPLFYEHRDWFYDWCEISSIYGAPADCLWGGGRTSLGDHEAREEFAMLSRYKISARLTFSNSLLTGEHLKDRKCNRLCAIAEQKTEVPNGVIVASDLLAGYLRQNYPGLYLVSSTTKVLADFPDFLQELAREEFRYVVPDFRLNTKKECLERLTQAQKNRTELLCNEGCFYGCRDRKRCYESVSRKNLGEESDFRCRAPEGEQGYRFSRAMQTPGFIGVPEILEWFLPKGFTQYKIEGRGLGSAVVLEMLLYYLTKPEYQLRVREEIYLDTMLDLF